MYDPEAHKSGGIIQKHQKGRRIYNQDAVQSFLDYANSTFNAVTDHDNNATTPLQRPYTEKQLLQLALGNDVSGLTLTEEQKAHLPTLGNYARKKLNTFVNTGSHFDSDDNVFRNLYGPTDRTPRNIVGTVLPAIKFGLSE